jgi:phage N-6-adenine-methyltransferase
VSPITQTKIPLSDEWATPVEVFATFDAEFKFTMDAAAKSWNAKVSDFMSPEANGLAQSWADEIVWLNPPYSDVGAWLAKAYEESQRGATVVALVPCSPDRHWWADHVEGKVSEVRLLTRRTLRTGRVHFVKEDGTSGRAPFASAVLIYRASSFLDGGGK